MSGHVSLKVATDDLLEIKKLWKLRFLGCFSKAKMEECDQKDWNISDKFAVIMPDSDKDFLEVSAHVSLKVATDNSFRDKETMEI